jgi:predicted HicB family RNase H-like nuclease
MIKPRKGDGQMKATMFRIEPDLHKALRIAAIEAGVSMNQAVKEAVEIWLKEQKRKGGKR